MISRAIAMSLPFAFALLIRVFEHFVGSFSESAIPLVVGRQMRLAQDVTRFGINLSEYTYANVSFVFGISLAGVVCFVHSVVGPIPVLAAIPGAAFIGLMLYWIFVWRNSSVEEPARKSMRIWSYTSICILWGLALLADFGKALGILQ